MPFFVLCLSFISLISRETRAQRRGIQRHGNPVSHPHLNHMGCLHRFLSLSPQQLLQLFGTQKFSLLKDRDKHFWREISICSHQRADLSLKCSFLGCGTSHLISLVSPEGAAACLSCPTLDHSCGRLRSSLQLVPHVNWQPKSNFPQRQIWEGRFIFFKTLLCIRSPGGVFFFGIKLCNLTSSLA